MDPKPKEFLLRKLPPGGELTELEEGEMIKKGDTVFFIGPRAQMSEVMQKLAELGFEDLKTFAAKADGDDEWRQTN